MPEKALRDWRDSLTVMTIGPDRYIAESRELPIIGDGGTVEKAVDAARSAISTGQKLVSIRSAPLHVRLPIVLRDRITTLARLQGISMNALVISLLAEGLGRSHATLEEAMARFKEEDMIKEIEQEATEAEINGFEQAKEEYWASSTAGKRTMTEGHKPSGEELLVGNLAGEVTHWRGSDDVDEGRVPLASRLS
jgi:hypothetical protein